MTQPPSAGDAPRPHGEPAEPQLPAVSAKPAEVIKRTDGTQFAAAPAAADLEALEHRLEARIAAIARREFRDPNAGLPDDEVLDRLNTRHPEVNFPERLMRRLEN